MGVRVFVYSSWFRLLFLLLRVEFKCVRFLKMSSIVRILEVGLDVRYEPNRRGERSRGVGVCVLLGT